MQLICVSRGSYSVGQAFASSLAAKLGWVCIGREELLERATEAGVAAGKLEMACLKPRGLNERMMLEREHFHAFASAFLAEQALTKPVVYHGRTGHLLLQGVAHVLRLRVVADLETRLKAVEERLGLDRVKAKRYIDEVEEDRRRWVRTFYGVDWDSSSGYDFIINLEHAHVDNVAAAFCGVATLPEFQETPASRKALEDILLANRCRVALAQDDRTYFASFRVRVESGVVSVTYLPRYGHVAEVIPQVVEGIPGVERVLCTMASTRILWIQERFSPQTESFAHIVELAEKWDAAVELLQLRASAETPIIERPSTVEEGLPPSSRSSTGGIEEDDAASASSTEEDDGGLEETCSELIKVGRSGGRTSVAGSNNDLLAAIDHTTSYSLVVIGDAFLSKGKAARVRLTRELGSTIHERMKVAVIQAEEMKEQYLFGPRQLVSLLVFLGLTGLIYYLVFSHEAWVMDLLARKETSWRMLATAFVITIVPLTAYLYGNAAHYLLKLIKME